MESGKFIRELGTVVSEAGALIAIVVQDTRSAQSSSAVSTLQQLVASVLPVRAVVQLSPAVAEVQQEARQQGSPSRPPRA